MYSKILVMIILFVGACFAGWLPPVNISGELVSDAREAAIFVDSDYVIHTAWTKYVSGGNEVFYTKSSDGGATWSELVNISESPEINSAYPALGVDSNEMIHLAWKDPSASGERISYRNSTDGITWSPIVNITDLSPYEEEMPLSYSEIDPSMYIDSSNNLHLVWYVPNWGFAYSKSTDHGASWTTPSNISYMPCNLATPSLVVNSSGAVFITWGCKEVDALGEDEIYLSISTDGTTWSAPLNISGSEPISIVPEMAIDIEDNIYVIWTEWDSSSFADIYYSKSINSGATWSTPSNISLTSSTMETWGGIVVGTDGIIHVLWTEQNTGWATYEDVYYVNSTDGVTWSTPELVSVSRNESYVYGQGFFIDNQNRLYADFEHWLDDSWSQVNIDFTRRFTPPLSSYTLKQSDGSAFNESSTSLRVNSSAVNVTWLGLNASQVYPLMGKNVTSSISIISDASSASIMVSENLLNLSANITITGLSGLTNPSISHDGVVVYENGALAAENGADDLLSEPTFADGTLTIEVGSFSEWTVEESSSGSAAGDLTISAPGYDYLLILVIFALSAVIMVKK